MNEWLREWWPIPAAILFLVVALGWFVQRMVKSSSADGARTAFETVFRKEMVQPIITHIMAWTFAVLAASMIITFLATRQFDRGRGRVRVHRRRNRPDRGVLVRLPGGGGEGQGRRQREQGPADVNGPWYPR